MYKWRKDKNLSLADIAVELGVTREAVRLWENGESRTSLENIVILASLLGVKTFDIERHFAVESMHRRGLDYPQNTSPSNESDISGH